VPNTEASSTSRNRRYPTATEAAALSCPHKEGTSNRRRPRRRSDLVDNRRRHIAPPKRPAETCRTHQPPKRLARRNTSSRLPKPAGLDEASETRRWGPDNPEGRSASTFPRGRSRPFP